MGIHNDFGANAGPQQYSITLMTSIKVQSQLSKRWNIGENVDDFKARYAMPYPGNRYAE